MIEKRDIVETIAWIALVIIQAIVLRHERQRAAVKRNRAELEAQRARCTPVEHPKDTRR